MFVGEDFVAEEERAHQAKRTSRALVCGSVCAPRTFPESVLPAYEIEATSPGGHLLVVDRNAARLELPAEKFEAYLESEGLHQVVVERAARGESTRPGRERYTRYLKALVQEGDATDTTFGKETGEALEILPLEDPTLARPGSFLPVRVLFQGKPLAAASLDAISNLEGELAVGRAVTDADGVARIAIDREATWMIRLVHMRRCEACEDADWESFWSSYTFGSRRGNGREQVAPKVIPTLPPPPSRPFAGSEWLLVGLAGGMGALVGRQIQRTRR